MIFASCLDGWLDGDGKAPSSDGLEWLRDAFECNYPDEVPVPHIYPTESGGVSLSDRTRSL